MTKMAGLLPEHFLWQVTAGVAVIRLNRPDRKNPLTFDSYAELRDTFRALVYAEDVDVVVFASNGGNFCSGGDVHDIIGPLIGLPMKDLLAFTRMTGDLVKAMISCGKPIIAAVDGVAVGAGAIIAMAADLRLATPAAKCAFLFSRVGLAGCDMGACAMLPRIVGQGRAAELLYTGRSLAADEGLAWGFWNALHPPETLQGDGAGGTAGRRPYLCAWDDQDPTQSRMEHGAGTGDRGRGAGAGNLHADPRLRTRLPGLCRPGKTRLRGRLTPDRGFSTPGPPEDIWTKKTGKTESHAAMSDKSFLDWPFFEDRHRDLAVALEAWCAAHLPVDHGDVDAACRGLVAALGTGGWLRHSGAGTGERLDVRTLCLIRETLARHDALADFAFAMQGLGLRPAVRPAPSRGLSAFLMPADAPGLTIAERLQVIAPHPLARLRLDGVELPEDALIGTAGEGFKIAMSVLDVVRPTVGAAALGLARRALDEALARTQSRRIQGQPLSALQMVQGHLADMALKIDAAALLVYRAAWVKDQGAPRVSREAAMAKLYATEAAQEVIDAALQLHGGDGVRHGTVVEALYREIRALRIYEGASDVQRVVIARSILG